jgi:dipeptidyl aminopeptidase/acylaminoacyl peptidase
MKKIILFLLFLSVKAFAQLPNTDIWLLDISSTKDSLSFSNPINITNRAGYDNQPTFSPDGKYILYTSIRDGKQSDIYKYTIKTKKISQFTKTLTSEYSPTFMPDGKNISVVMVEPDSAQRLWQFPLKGGAPTCIMKDVDSVGYHCWINKDSLALVMITEPASLYVVNTKTQKQKLFEKNVSRCVQKNPLGTGFFYMVQNKAPHNLWTLSNSNHKNRSKVIVNDNGDKIIDDVAAFSEPLLPETTQDYYFYSASKKTPVVIFGNDSKLLVLDLILNNIQSQIDFSSYGITNITRLTVSPDGKKIAIVAESK